jgi:hypothetical protein
MTTLDIAKKYVELCAAHQNDKALETLFAKDAVSIEAGGPPGVELEARGLPAIFEKSKKWVSEHEVHSAKVEGPWPKANQFIVRFSYDITNKPSGRRMQMEEAALLTVENDKIVREEFFYAMG